MPAVLETPVLTPDDLLKLSDEKIYELINGQLVEKDMGYNAVRIAFVIGWILESFLRKAKLGEVTCEASFDCFPSAEIKVRRPDVSFIRAGRIPEGKARDGNLKIAPDLAVEVVSPNDTAYELEVKVGDYLMAGVQQVWLVYPHKRCIQVRQRDGSAKEFLNDQTLICEELFPGFSCKVEEFFS